jgi:cytochrome c553
MTSNRVKSVTAAERCSVWGRVLCASGLLALALLGACDSRKTPTRVWQPSDHGQPAQEDPSRVAAPAEPEEGGTDRAAAALFNVSCAGCHGRDGKGLGAQRPPGGQLPDFTVRAFQAQRSDAQLADVIRKGRGLMPPFGKQVNDQGIAALVSYIRKFAP